MQLHWKCIGLAQRCCKWFGRWAHRFCSGSTCVWVCIWVSGWRILVRTTILKHYIHVIVYIAMNTHSFGWSWGLAGFLLSWCDISLWIYWFRFAHHFNGINGIFFGIFFIVVVAVVLSTHLFCIHILFIYTYLGSESSLSIKC